MERIREWKMKQKLRYSECNLTAVLAEDVGAFLTLISKLKMELSALTLNFLAFSSLR